MPIFAFCMRQGSATVCTRWSLPLGLVWSVVRVSICARVHVHVSRLGHSLGELLWAPQHNFCRIWIALMGHHEAMKLLRHMIFRCVTTFFCIYPCRCYWSIKPSPTPLNHVILPAKCLMCSGHYIPSPMCLVAMDLCSRSLVTQFLTTRVWHYLGN